MQVNKVMDLVGTKIFTVTFTKKDGSIRVMNAKRGVKKHLKGGELPYDPIEHNLMTVFDMQLGEYRTVNTTKIQEIKAEGKIYNFVDGELVE